MRRLFLVGGFVASAVALATAVGCASFGNREAATIRVGSYNIRLQTGDTGTPNAWDERKADMVELIRKLDLDAFGLQEVCPGQADYLTNSLPQYVMVGVHREDGVRKGEASPVFYRRDRFDAVTNGTFWLSETPDVPGSKSWGTACTRVCSWALLKDRTTGKAFCFANTHTDHVSALARKEGMLLIVRRMREFAPPGAPIVFTGDHNCRETDEPAQAVSKLLKNALYVSETPPTGPWRTFTGWRWRDREYPAAKAMKLAPEVRNACKDSPDADTARRCGPRIDYIYVSDGIRVLSYATHGDARPGKELYPSDHFPVSAVIELPGEPVVEKGEPKDVPPLFEEGEARTAEEWRTVRRPAVKKLLEDEVYGKRPVERPPHLVFSPLEPDTVMMDGAAVRKRVRVEYGGAYGTNSFTFTAFIPRQGRPAPSFVFICNRPPDEVIDPTRRTKSGFWPAEEIVARGYAAIAFAFDEVTPDREHGNTLGVFAAFEDVTAKYRPYNRWGALSAWGWAASRILDWIETEPALDARHVAVIGHSRGGKAALVAAAWDERFAMACSNESGCGGAKLHHVGLPMAETIAYSIRSRSFWYCKQYAMWANRDGEAPFDQHWLVAMIAPRLVCIGSATDDALAGPYGEYLTARFASEAWRAFGSKGLVSDAFPAPETPQQDGDVSYHLRTGKHDLTPFDWNVYMDFADRHGWRNADAIFSVSADHADCLYTCGEKATFTISTPQTVGTAVVTLDDFSTNVVARATFDLSKANTFTISGTLGEPGFMRLRVGVSGGAKQKIYGVGFEPEKIRKTSPSPDDFDAFWSEAKRKLDETTPVDARLERVEERCNDKWDFYRISVASYKGRVWGWLSVPKDASAERRYPVRVEVPGAGKGKWAHDMTPVPGAVCLKMTAHSFPLAFDDKEFLRQYAELEREVKEKYGVSNYAVAGLGKSREEFYYYRAFLGISRAVDWVVAQPWADKSSVTYSGGSQGGGFGLALLALNRNFTKGLLKVPALSDNMAPLVGRRSGCGPCHIFGQPEADRETAIKWAPYFDGANFASRITCPVRVLVGFADDTCPPSAVYATYNEIRAKDHAIVHGIGMGHGCDKNLVAQLEKWLYARD